MTQSGEKLYVTSFTTRVPALDGVRGLAILMVPHTSQVR